MKKVTVTGDREEPMATHGHSKCLLIEVSAETERLGGDDMAVNVHIAFIAEPTPQFYAKATCSSSRWHLPTIHMAAIHQHRLSHYFILYSKYIHVSNICTFLLPSNKYTTVLCERKCRRLAAEKFFCGKLDVCIMDSAC
jgi:hypothetical protein